MIRRRLWGYLNEGDVDLPVLMDWSMLPRNGLPCPLHARQIFHTKPESEIHFGSFKLKLVMAKLHVLFGVTPKDQATRNYERDPWGGSTGLEHCLRATDYLTTNHVTSQPVPFLSPPRPVIAIPPSQGITAAQVSSSLFAPTLTSSIIFLAYQHLFIIDSFVLSC